LTQVSGAIVEKEFHLGAIDPLLFYGINDRNLKIIKKAYPEIRLIARGSSLLAIGNTQKIQLLSQLIQNILAEIERGGGMPEEKLLEILIRNSENHSSSEQSESSNPLLSTRIIKDYQNKWIKVKTEGQNQILKTAEENPITFVLGPAGTGKTFISVAIAIKSLFEEQVRKIVLTRPAVEAGENLGFLPGDFKEKVAPYLRPLYDALELIIHPEQLHRLLELNIIEVVPFAYMRGRSLNHAFILVDEAQNATIPQLKMLLTRMGQGSRIIITGDPTQIDLPNKQMSGLVKVTKLLQKVEGVGIVHMKREDIVRHPLVQKIVEVFEANNL
jgi:phosphate starvation-inducible PhoH-like protein